jgi:hypothetical protein
MKKKAEPAAATATGVQMSSEVAHLVSEALQDETSGFNRMATPRSCVLKLFARIDQLAGKIDLAFLGQPFMPHLPPDAPANVRRAKTYFRLHQENTRLLERAIRLWMLSYGMKPEDDWTPIVVEHMRRGYAERQNNFAVPTSDHGRNMTSNQTSTTHINPVNVNKTVRDSQQEGVP